MQGTVSSLLSGSSWGAPGSRSGPAAPVLPPTLAPPRQVGDSGLQQEPGCWLRASQAVILASLLCSLLGSPGPGSLCTSPCCSSVGVGEASAVVWSCGQITLWLHCPQSLAKSVGSAHPLCPRTPWATMCHPFPCHAASNGPSRPCLCVTSCYRVGVSVVLELCCWEVTMPCP